MKNGSVKALKAIFYALVGLIVTSSAVRADTFTWTFVDRFHRYSASGTLTASPLGVGNVELITSFTGTFDHGLPIVNLLPQYTFHDGDNLLYGLAPRWGLDIQGVSFTTGTSDWNLSLSGPGLVYELQGTVPTMSYPFYATTSTKGQFRVSAVSEPSSMMLLAGGLLGTLGVVRRRLLR